MSSEDPYLLGENDILFEALIRESKKPEGKINADILHVLNNLAGYDRWEFLNCRDISTNCTPLFFACKHGNLQNCTYLLKECGADQQIRGSYEVNGTLYEVTPLWIAAKLKHIEIIQLLLDTDVSDDEYEYDNDLPSIDTLLTEVASALHKNRLYEKLIKSYPMNIDDHIEIITELIKLPLNERKEIINRRDKNGCTPFFLAVQRLNVILVKYMLDNCDPDIDQIGVIKERREDRLTDTMYVTPLYVAVKLDAALLVKLLIDSGANVNFKCENNGSTPIHQVHSLEIAELLGENGADILISDYNGRNCLMNDCSTSVYKYFIENGAKSIINSLDCNNKSALDIVIRYNHINIETVKYFIKNGAHTTEDTLRAASLSGNEEILCYLIKNVSYLFSHHFIADAYELIGSKIFYHDSEQQNTFSNSEKAKFYWNLAAKLRKKYELFPKQYHCSNIDPDTEKAASLFFKGVKEFQNEEEVENLGVSEMRMQSLLIYHRILGPHNTDLNKMYLEDITLIGSDEKYQNTIDVMLFRIQIYLVHDDLLMNTNYIFITFTFVHYFLLIHHIQGSNNNFSYKLRFEDLIRVTTMLVNGLLKWKELLNIRPVCEDHVNHFDRILSFSTHLFYLLNKHATTPDHIIQMKNIMREAVEINPITKEGNTLLHLIVTERNIIREKNTDDVRHELFRIRSKEFDEVFPDYDVIKLLIECGAGACINQVNNFNSTPLHYASCEENFDPQIVKLLLDNGGHIDQVNNYDLKPIEQIEAVNTSDDLCAFNYMSLQCIAANAVCEYNIPYTNLVPNIIKNFIDNHKCSWHQ